MSLNIFCEAKIYPDIRLALLRAQPSTMAAALRCAENERILLQAARRATPTVMSHYDPQQGVPVNLSTCLVAIIGININLSPMENSQMQIFKSLMLVNHLLTVCLKV